jgi:hypothetical protein
MSEATASDVVDNDWTDANDEADNGHVEGFEEGWGDSTKLPDEGADVDRAPDRNTMATKIDSPAKIGPGPVASENQASAAELSSAEELHEAQEHDTTTTDSWSWGAAWTAFTGAVQQVK